MKQTYNILNFKLTSLSIVFYTTLQCFCIATCWVNSNIIMGICYEGLSRDIYKMRFNPAALCDSVYFRFVL